VSGSGKGAASSAGGKVHASGYSKNFFSPDLLLQLKPPGTTLKLDHQQHRFRAVFEVENKYQKGLSQEHAAKHFSRSFATSRNWQECLQKVHQWLWLKYKSLPSKAKAPCTEQEPGQIPEEMLQQLGLVVNEMPPLKKYKASTLVTAGMGARTSDSY
jgi:hypothetical protein